MILIDIANKSHKTRDEIALELGVTRMGLYHKLKKPHKHMTLDDLHKFAICVGRSSRNLYALLYPNKTKP